MFVLVSGGSGKVRGKAVVPHCPKSGLFPIRKDGSSSPELKLAATEFLAHAASFNPKTLVDFFNAILPMQPWQAVVTFVLSRSHALDFVSVSYSKTWTLNHLPHVGQILRACIPFGKSRPEVSAWGRRSNIRLQERVGERGVERGDREGEREKGEREKKRERERETDRE